MKWLINLFNNPKSTKPSTELQTGRADLSFLPAEFGDHPQVHEIIEFIRAGGERAVCTPRDVKDSAA